jgi:hypothetical protein
VVLELDPMKRVPLVQALVAETIAAARRLEAPDDEDGRAALRDVLRAFVRRLEVSPARRTAPRPVRMEVGPPARSRFSRP